MVCTLQRKHDERYENTRKEALARISFLVQTRAGFEEKFTERLRAAERLRVAEKKQGVVIIEGQKKQVVCYELKREPLAVLVFIIMMLEDALL